MSIDLDDMMAQLDDKGGAVDETPIEQAPQAEERKRLVPLSIVVERKTPSTREQPKPVKVADILGLEPPLYASANPPPGAATAEAPAASSSQEQQSGKAAPGAAQSLPALSQAALQATTAPSGAAPSFVQTLEEVRWMFHRAEPLRNRANDVTQPEKGDPPELLLHSLYFPKDKTT
jgi:hypothetical protein